jgi:hypothetical protein
MGEIYPEKVTMGDSVFNLEEQEEWHKDILEHGSLKNSGALNQAGITINKDMHSVQTK